MSEQNLPPSEKSDSASPVSPVNTPPVPAQGKRWRWGRRILIALAIVLLTLAGALYWLITTPGGFSTLLALAKNLTGGQIVAGGESGSLWEKPAIAELKLNLGKTQVTVQNLGIDWDLRQLRERTLAIRNLRVDAIDIVHPASQEPATLPADLHLPLSIIIDQININRFLFRNESTKQPSIDIENIDASLSSTGNLHRIGKLNLTSGDIQAQINGEIAAATPFALKLNGRVSGEEAGHDFKLQIQGGGNLAAIDFDLTADGILQGSAKGTATPFAAQPFTYADIVLTGVDPAKLKTGAPGAQLDLQAHIAPAPSSGIAPDNAPNAETAGTSGESAQTPAQASDLPINGHFTLINHRTGRIDANLIPVARAEGQLEWRNQALDLKQLLIALPDSADSSKPATPDKTGAKKTMKAAPAGQAPTLQTPAHRANGRLQGSARYENNIFNLSLNAVDIDASSIHGKAQPTRISGPIQARIAEKSIEAEANLNDPRFIAQLNLVKTEEQIEIRQLLLKDTAQPEAAMSLALAGQLHLSGSQAFTLQGKLERFDPSRFIKSPPARLNAELQANGEISPARLALKFNLADSTFDNRPAQGHGELNFDGARKRLLSSDVSLQLADSRFELHGAFGAPDDQLEWKLAAPKLDVAGINGDLAGEGRLSGNLAQADSLALYFDLRSDRLKLPDGSLLVKLLAQGQASSGESSPLKLAASLQSLDRAGETGVVNAAELSIDGNRRQHRINLKTGLADKRRLEAAANGGLDSTWNWRGMLDKLVLSGAQPVRLVSPAALTLTLTPAGAEINDVNLAGEGWTSHIARVRYVDGKLETSGKLDGVPLTLLAPQPVLSRSTIRFGSEWAVVLPNIDDPAGWNGEISIARQEGDLILNVPGTKGSNGDGGEAQAAGLKQLAANLSLKNNQLAMRFDAQSERLGSAHFTGQSRFGAANESPAMINTSAGSDNSSHMARIRDAPWQGQLTLNMPSIAWLDSLLDENSEVAGRVEIEAKLAGTPKKPEITGRINIQDLTLALLDQGTRLERGTLEIALTGAQARIEKAEIFGQLRNEAQHKPNETRIDLAAIEKTSANARKASISGTIDLAAQQADLVLTLDKLPVLQNPQQWLMLSGSSRIRLEEGKVGIQGKLTADAAYWELADIGTPQLSDDVEIAGRQKKSAATTPVSLDLEADCGKQAYLRGAGINTRLGGSIKIAGARGRPIQASGTINTVGGTFDAYGTHLDIERGIVNFRGLLDNPGLNIRAIRKNLQVEAGVEVSGTIQRPVVKLVSTPVVPDAEKLSWIVLGHGTEQGEGVDSGLLLSAATAILGESGMTSSLKQTFGIDEFSVGAGKPGESSGQKSSRVASSQGFGANSNNNDQVLNVGKRLASNITLGYERSLTSIDNLVKLTVNLTRRLSLIARTGSDNSVDLFYTFSFGRK